MGIPAKPVQLKLLKYYAQDNYIIIYIICEAGEKPYHYFTGNDMAQLKEVFAHNLRAKRRKSGLTQAQLAEKVEVSTHHIAMIEIARNYPTLELAERIAGVLDIEVYKLFLEQPAPKDAMEKLHDSLVGNIERVVCEAVKEAITKQCKVCNRKTKQKGNSASPKTH